MKFIFNEKDFLSYSKNKDFNRIFLDLARKRFYTLYKKYKVLNLVDFLNILEYKDIKKYEKENNIIWIKDQTNDPKIEINGNEITII